MPAQVCLAGALALTAVLTSLSPAAAADLPRRAAPPPAFTPVPVFTWTGFYAGVNAGAGFGGGGGTFTDGHLRHRDPGHRDAAFVGGGQIGYNYQFTPGSGFVIAPRPTSRAPPSGGPAAGSSGPRPSTTSARPRLVRHGARRIGYAFEPLPGLRHRRLRLWRRQHPGERLVLYRHPAGDLRTGWTAGGGVEYAITERLSARIEALYVSLDRNGGSGGLVYDTGTNAYYGLGKPKSEFGVVRAGLNYRFSTD